MTQGERRLVLSHLVMSGKAWYLPSRGNRMRVTIGDDIVFDVPVSNFPDDKLLADIALALACGQGEPRDYYRTQIHDEELYTGEPAWLK